MACKCDIVLEGGGCKGIAHVGALAALEVEDFQPIRFAGSSAGAIVAALKAAGYKTAELNKIMFDLDFNKFKDGGQLGTKLYNLVRHKGIYKNDYFYHFIKDRLKEKGVTFFGDLYNTNLKVNDRWKLKIYATDISNSRLIEWPKDAKLFGLDPNYLDVSFAVKSSISIPFYFRPVKLRNSYLVDGGVLSNYPISAWDSNSLPRWPTFGLLLEEANSNKQNETKSIIDFGKALFETMLSAHDKRFIEPGDYKHRTIKIPTGTIKATDFDLTNQQKNELYQSGYDTTNNFLNNWHWENYVDWAKKVRGIV